MKKCFSFALVLALSLSLLPTAALGSEITVTELVSGKYDSMGEFAEGLLRVSLDGKYGFLDETGRETIPCTLEYRNVSNFRGGLAVVRKGEYMAEKSGFIDQTGQEVIPCKYDVAHDFSEGLAAVRMGDSMTGKWGFVDRTGWEAIPCKYDEVQRFQDGLAKVKLNGKYGYIDQGGQEVVPCIYDEAEDFSEGFAWVRRGESEGSSHNWSLVDRTGREVISDKYVFVMSFSEGYAAVTRYGAGGYSTYVDTTGREVSWKKYDLAFSFSNGYATVGTGSVFNGKYGLIDRTGREVIPCKYDNVNDMGGGLFQVSLGNKSGCMDTEGNLVIPIQYNGITRFQEDIAIVSVGDMHNSASGYIDRTGREFLFGMYSFLTSFREGLASVQLYGLYGCVDKEGNEVIPCKYISSFYFSEGLAKVAIQSEERTKEGNFIPKYGVIDRTGREVVPCEYDELDWLTDTLLKVKKGKKYGILAVSGRGSGDQSPQPAAPIAYASPQPVLVDGKAVEFQCYALKDEKGNDTNYIKLRDVASILNGTAAQFEVGWDGAVNIETGKPYTANGSEMSTPFSGDRSYEGAAAETRVNGEGADLEAIVLTDDGGKGYTYYKLRDLGAALGFRVDWSAEKGIFIETE